MILDVSLFVQPCGDKLIHFFRENAKIIGAIVAGICAIEVCLEDGLKKT